MKQVELLSPAGDRLSFIGAINAGCNAVYLAGKRFGARSFAQNFEVEEIIEMIKYAHLRNVLVYVTLNTLVYDDEIPALIEYADILVKNHVDALIIQDLGVLEIFSKRYPSTDLHASTQMNTLNVEQAKFLKSIGVKRIILARETSIEEIKHIKENVDIELEVFIHGALCISYSGNCYFSSMIGGRSGNRGECAQSCRLPYELYKEDELIEDKSYLLSAKDLITIDHLEALIELGINSLKIEGRMRKPEYVVQSVKSYRNLIDSYYYNQEIDNENEKDKLTKVFNRGQTKGFLFNETPKDIVNSDKPNHVGVTIGKVISFNRGKVTLLLSDSLSVNDGIKFISNKESGMTVSRISKNDMIISQAFSGEVVVLDSKDPVEVGSVVVKTSDSELENTLSVFLKEDYTSIPLKGTVNAYLNNRLSVEVVDELNNRYFVESDFLIPEAKNQPITKENLYEHFYKLGNTPFAFETLEIKSNELGFIPVKVINELRRDLIEKIIAEKTKRPEIKIVDHNYSKNIDLNIENKPNLIVSVNNTEQFEAAINSGINEIYLDANLTIKNDAYKDTKITRRQRRINPFADYKQYKETVISEVGLLNKKEKFSRMITDEFMNVTNIYSVHFLHLNGVERITLSSETNQYILDNIVKNYLDTFKTFPNLEKVVYGREELMISKYCPIAKSYGTNVGCMLCYKNQYYLKDRKDEMYPLINDGLCNIKIMHSRPLVLIDYVFDLIQNGIYNLRLNFTTESYEETVKIIKAYQNAINKLPFNLGIDKYTKGRYITKVAEDF